MINTEDEEFKLTKHFNSEDQRKEIEDAIEYRKSKPLIK